MQLHLKNLDNYFSFCQCEKLNLFAWPELMHVFLWDCTFVRKC